MNSQPYDSALCNRPNLWAGSHTVLLRYATIFLFLLHLHLNVRAGTVHESVLCFIILITNHRT